MAAAKSIAGLALLGVGLAAFAQDDAPAAPAVTAQSLIEGALDLTRGEDSSYSEMAMVVHRPSWERRYELAAWTQGREDALIRFTAPEKDAGTATLKKGERMWTFTPKHKREIRLPASAMSGSWAGSDFSYNDLSRTDSYLRYYDYEITNTEQQEDRTVYTITLTPHDDAPVVWGREEMVMRDDYVLLSQTYFDQDDRPLKQMRAMDIGELGDRTIALASRMIDLEDPEKWTEIRFLNADFDANIDADMFTTFALRSGRGQAPVGTQ